MIHIQLVNDDKNALILAEKLFELKLLVNIQILLELWNILIS